MLLILYKTINNT